MVKSVSKVLGQSNSLMFLNSKIIMVEFESRSKLKMMLLDCEATIRLRVAKIFRRLPSALV